MEALKMLLAAAAATAAAATPPVASAWTLAAEPLVFAATALYRAERRRRK